MILDFDEVQFRTLINCFIWTLHLQNQASPLKMEAVSVNDSVCPLLTADVVTWSRFSSHLRWHNFSVKDRIKRHIFVEL
jgi:hypothetical protein